MTTNLIINQLLVGIATTSILFLVSSGLNVIFGLLGIINFAHASLYALGAYIAYTVAIYSGSFWVALIVAPVVVAIIGAGVEAILLRRIYKQEDVYQLLLTFGLILIFEDLTTVVWGTSPITIPSLGPFLSSGLEIAGSYFPTYYLFIIVMGIVVGLGLILFLDKTRPGKMLKAAITNKDMAATLGLNVKLTYTLVFALGAWLGGFGGVLAGGINTMQPDMGMWIIIDSFAVVVMGGLGNIYGAMLGSLIIGLWKAFGLLIIPQFSMVFIYIAMVVVLIWKPEGLFGSRNLIRKA